MILKNLDLLLELPLQLCPLIISLVEPGLKCLFGLSFDGKFFSELIGVKFISFTQFIILSCLDFNGSLTFRYFGSVIFFYSNSLLVLWRLKFSHFRVLVSCQVLNVRIQLTNCFIETGFLRDSFVNLVLNLVSQQQILFFIFTLHI